MKKNTRRIFFFRPTNTIRFVQHTSASLQRLEATEIRKQKLRRLIFSNKQLAIALIINRKIIEKKKENTETADKK